jgi:thioredoxin reductase
MAAVNYDVAVIGGGPAGLAAAAATARHGLRTVLFDENPTPGGQLRYRPVEITHRGHRAPALAGGDVLAKAALAEGAELVMGSIVWGLFPGLTLGVSGEAVSGEVSAERVVIASGETELAMAFPGSDLPGVMTGTGLLRMLHLHHVWPGGKRVALVGDDLPIVDEVTAAVERAGGSVTARLTGRPIVRERDGVVSSVRDEAGGDAVETDLVAICAGTQPDIALALMLECDTGHSAALGGFVPQRSRGLETSIAGVFVCGGAAGRGSIESHIAEGELAGVAVAASLGRTGGDEVERAARDLATIAPERVGAARAVTADWRQHAVEAVRARGVGA